MAIVSSSYVSDQHTQPSGGRWTIETHTDGDGVKYTVGPYLWDGVSDRDLLMAARAAALSDSLAEAEAAALLG
jgi:hypothetical protein